MYEIKKNICLNQANELEEFINAATQCDFDIDVRYKNAFIDAKSILGMLAIGLNNTITVCYGGSNENFENVIRKYAIA